MIGAHRASVREFQSSREHRGAAPPHPRTHLLLLAAAALVVGSCAPTVATEDRALTWRLGSIRRALGQPRRGAPTRVLRFSVDGPNGRWTHEIAVGQGLFAERRTRFDGDSYTFGEDTRGPWMRVGDGPVREASDEWRREERTERGLFGLRFLMPSHGDAAEILQDTGRGWEYEFQPAGGHTLVFAGNDEQHEPVMFDSFDDFGRLVVCEHLDWSRDRFAPFLRNARCHTSGLSREWTPRDSRLRLVATEEERLGEAPDWVLAEGERVPRASFDAAVEVRPEYETQITLDVTANGATIPMVLDSGSTFTTLDASVARRLGVVPTGEAPIFMRPPWLPSGVEWVGVIDHAGDRRHARRRNARDGDGRARTDRLAGARLLSPSDRRCGHTA